MSKQNQKVTSEQKKQNKPQTAPDVVAGQVQEQAMVSELSKGLIGIAGGSSIQDQATHLSDTRFSKVQRQAMATQIGREGGNQHLQRIMLQMKQDEQAHPKVVNQEEGQLYRTVPSPAAQIRYGVGQVMGQYEQELVQRDETHHDFSDSEGSEVRKLTRDEPDEEIKDIHSQIGKEIEYFHNEKWKVGLENFIDTMQFSSAQEAETNNTAAIGKSVAKSLLYIAIGATAGIPVVGPVVSPLLRTAANVGFDTFKEDERGQRAGSEREINTYITGLRTKISESRVEMDRAHTDSFSSVLESYREATRSSPSSNTQKGEGAWVYDDAARWIARYKQALERFRVQLPSASKFQQLITEEFALTGQMVGYVTSGTRRPSGTLSLNVHVLRERADGQTDWRWSVEDIDDHWTLGTSAPNPIRVAQNLLDSLKGFPIMTHCNLPKRINLTIETEVPGFNEETQGALHILPDHSFIAESSGNSNLIRESATSPVVGLRILEVKNIVGSSR